MEEEEVVEGMGVRGWGGGGVGGRQDNPTFEHSEGKSIMSS